MLEYYDRKFTYIYSIMNWCNPFLLLEKGLEMKPTNALRAKTIVRPTHPQETA